MSTVTIRATNPKDPIQTFLPYPDYMSSAEVLDKKRLGKQRVECIQILTVLLQHNLYNPEKEPYTWGNHPMTRMWAGYELSLLDYTDACMGYWAARGGDNGKTIEAFLRAEAVLGIDSTEWIRAPKPPWVGREDLHLSHQSNLIRKDPDYYRPIFGNDVPDDLPYVWPVDREPQER